MIDLCSRRLVGWAIADHMRTELVINALGAAERIRGSLRGAVMHADQVSKIRGRGPTTQRPSPPTPAPKSSSSNDPSPRTDNAMGLDLRRALGESDLKY